MLPLNHSQCWVSPLPLWGLGVPLLLMTSAEGKVGKRVSRRLAIVQAGNGSRFLIAPNRMWACKLLTWDARRAGGLGKIPKSWRWSRKRRSRRMGSGTEKGSQGEDWFHVSYPLVWWTELLIHLYTLASQILLSPLLSSLEETPWRLNYPYKLYNFNLRPTILIDPYTRASCQLFGLNKHSTYCFMASLEMM